MVSNYISDDDRCFVCGNDQLHLLDSHHIVPRRYGGSDEMFNRVALCKNCHGAIERIYTDEVFRRIGAVRNPDKRDQSIEENPHEFFEWDTAEKFDYLQRNHSGLKLKTPDGTIIDMDWCLDMLFEKIGKAESVPKEDSGEQQDVEMIDRHRNEKQDAVKETVADLCEEYNDRPGAPVGMVLEVLEGKDLELTGTLSTRDIESTIRKLRDKGKIYSPDPDHLRPV